MPQINLASEVFRARLVARRRRAFYALTIGVLLLVLAFWGLPVLLKMSVERQVADLEQEITGLEAQLRTRQEEVKAVRLFAQRLALLKERLGAHVGWSNVLKEFERTMTPVTAFRKLSGSVETGAITAEAVVPSLDAAADFVASLQRVQKTNETFFTTVEATGFSANTEAGGESGSAGYRVALRLTVPTKVFSLVPSAL